ncbi:MAG: hypothetical protein ABI895_35755 [Deltaproteobacteria bacterium]
MIPIYACPGATEIFERFSAKTPPGEFVDMTCEQNRRDVEMLSANSYPIGDVPWQERPEPAVRTRHVAAFLVDQLARVIAGKSDGPDVDARLSVAFEAFFGFRPDQAWLPSLLAEIRSAALQQLNWNRRVANLDESKRAGIPEPPALLAHAALVLDQTRTAVASSGMPCELPNWLDVQLVAYLIPRFGFARGKGGANRVISERTMAHLLVSPRSMIKDLKRSPKGAVRWEAHITKLQLDPMFREAVEDVTQP